MQRIPDIKNEHDPEPVEGVVVFLGQYCVQRHLPLVRAPAAGDQPGPPAQASPGTWNP